MQNNMNRKLALLQVRKAIGKTISTILKIACSIAFAFPFFWMISTSLKTYMESIQNPPTLWPKEISIEGYITVFESLNLWQYLKNSLIILVAIVIIQMIVMVPAAYAFAKKKFVGKGIMFGLVMVAFMIPTQVTYITIYIMFSGMSVGSTPMIETLLPQIIPFGANAYGIFLLRQNFMQVPEELIESAKLDRAGEVRIMTRIMLPMAKSTIVTIALMCFISQWNAYFWPLVMTNTEEVRPITMAIAKLKNLEYGMPWPTIMAGTALLVIPILILFLLASKKIIQSMAYRGMK